MIVYEWTIELVDPSGDIVDSDFADKFNELPVWEGANGHKIERGLVWNQGNERTGLTDRLWAYIKDGKLPEYFSNAEENITSQKVPARFHNELKNIIP